MMEILSKGERLRLIREKLNMTQEELGGSKYSSSYIDEIERSKTPLEANDILFFVHSLNKKLQECGKNSLLSLKYFTDDGKIVAKKRSDVYQKIVTDGMKDLQAYTILRLLNRCLMLSDKYTLDIEGDIYFLKGSYYRELKQYKCATANFRQALEYFRLINNMEMHVQVCLILGNIAYNNEDYKIAQFHYQEAHFISSRCKDEPKMYKVLYNLALVNYKLKQNIKAMNLLNIIQKNHNTSVTNNYYMLKIILLFELGDINNALTLINDFKKKKLDANEMAKIYNNLAILLIEKKRIKLALEYGEKGLQLKKKTASEDPYSLRHNYDTLSKVYLLDGNFEKSIEYSRLILSVTNNSKEVCSAYMLMAKAYIELAKYQNAQECLDIVIDIATTNEHFKTLSEAYFYLSKIHYNTGSFHKASIYSKTSLKWQELSAV